MPTKGISLTNDEYTIGWICVNDVEWHAARILLDETHSRPSAPGDDYHYVGGQMSGHNITICKSVAKGRAAATNVATNMLRTFRKIRFVLIVGIGGGATTAPPPPGVGSRPEDIFLGDVVVSAPTDTHGGILQYDMGKRVLGEHQIRSHLNRPPAALIKATENLRINWPYDQGNMQDHIEEGLRKFQRMPSMRTFRYPGHEYDQLFESSYHHKEATHEEGPCANCAEEHIIPRHREDNIPRIHYGLIGSADTLVRDAEYRDHMRSTYDLLCFEMETAGLANEFPCLAIRGISDYSDDHKNDFWHPYAALTAAAYAKELLASLEPESVFGADVAIKFVKPLVGATKSLEYEQRNDIFTWLSALDFNSKQDRLLKDCVSTFRWLTDMNEFKLWMNGTKWQLRCYGEAGVGKTFLCAQIIDHLKKSTFPSESSPSPSESSMLLSSSTRPVIFIYLTDEKESWATQTPENILGSLVKQLIQHRGDGDIPEEIKQAHQGLRAREPTLKKTFETLLGEFDRTYLIVDGLYQCTEEVLGIVKSYPLDLIKREFPLSLLTTSSGYREVMKLVSCDNCEESDIEVFYNCECNMEDFDLCPKCRHENVSCPQHHVGKETYDTVRIAMRGCNRDEDIVKFCLSKLDSESTIGLRESDTRTHAPPPIRTHVGRYLFRNPEMKIPVAEEIAKNAQGNFLAAKAWIDELLAMNFEPQSFDQLVPSLGSVPKKVLAGGFNERIERIKHWKSQEDLQLAFTAVSVAMTALRPLSILALQHALSLDSRDFIKEGHFDTRVDIIRAANGLLCIDRADVSNSFVRLFHPSLGVLSVGSELDLPVKKPHLKMANLCLKYLEHTDFEDHSLEPSSYPFLSYSLEYWADHVREANDLDLMDRLLGLLMNTDRVKDIAHRAGALNSRIPSSWIYNGVDAVHLCAWYNLPLLIRRLVLQGGYDINALDGKLKRTPLRYACINGNIEAAREILALGGKPKNDRSRNSTIRNTIQGLSRTESFHDQGLQRLGILKLILDEANLTLDSPIDSRGSTILMHAVKEKCYNFVGVLLNEDSIDVNIEDSHGRTALWYAVGRSNVSSRRSDLKSQRDIVKLLVSHDASPSTCKQAVIHAITCQNLGLVSIICPGLGISLGLKKQIRMMSVPLSGSCSHPLAEEKKQERAHEKH